MSDLAGILHVEPCGDGTFAGTLRVGTVVMQVSDWVKGKNCVVTFRARPEAPLVPDSWAADFAERNAALIRA